MTIFSSWLVSFNQFPTKNVFTHKTFKVGRLNFKFIDAFICVQKKTTTSHQYIGEYFNLIGWGESIT